MQFLYVFFFLIFQLFFLYSYEFSPDNNRSCNIPQVKISFNDNNIQKLNGWHLSASMRTIPDYADKRSFVSTVPPSPALTHFVTDTVTSLIYFTTAAEHYCALPGYAFPDGLRHCISGLSSFIASDAAWVTHFTDRLETYCTRIENILYDTKHILFRDNISYDDRVALIQVYADFLKEFYGNGAQRIFDNHAQLSPLMRQVKPEIKWCCYGDNTLKNTLREQQLYNAASLNGNLGAMYKALHEGNSEQAYAIGHERVKTIVPGRMVGKTEYEASVFERYPVLYKKVEQTYLADKAKVKQERLAKQNFAQQGAAIIKAEFKEGVNIAALLSRHDIVQKRHDMATYQINDPRFFEKLHKIVAEHAARIDTKHLTPDQKGILFEGGHLQHHLVDEAISVVDTAISGDLIENMQDAVIDLANTSISLNKEGDVVRATYALDTCWALLDHAHNAAKYAYAGMLNNMHPIERGIYHGALDSAKGAVRAVLHPIQTAQEVAQSFVVGGYCLGKLAYASCVYDAACDVLESDPKRYEHMISQYAIDPEALTAIYEHLKNNASVENVARFGTKTVIDMMLLHSVTTVVSAVAKDYWSNLISCMRKGGQSSEIALTVENIPVQCGEEIASIVQKMESTQKVGGSAKVIQEDIVQKIRNVGDDILDVMEKAGGHTLERHVAQTNTNLFARSLKVQAEAITTFINKRIAIKAVKESLKKNAEKISLWLSNSLENEIILECSHLHSIGNGILKGKKSSLNNLTNSRMVLKKDSLLEFGFKIVTAFPIV